MFWIQIGLAFLAGMFFVMLLSTFVTLGYRVIMIKASQRSCLEMLKTSSDSIDSMLTTLTASSEERKLFEKSYNVMKDLSVLKLKGAMPVNCKNLARYNDWAEAMAFLNKERENDR
tara:strand:- start:358 stop:705 length:348 start_codon:yes stop_codon:yes gene_type:complete